MRLLLLLLASAAALAVSGTAAATTAENFRLATNSDARFPDYLSTARRQEFVVLNAWQHEHLHALKDANPNVKVLVYKNLGFMAEGRSWTGFSASGVNADEASPDWFLVNGSGERFTSWTWRWLWAADVGNPAYQQRWADNVISELRRYGWDGVFMDDTNPTMKYHHDAGDVAKYPDDAPYSAAMRSAIAAIGPRIEGERKLAIANIGTWHEPQYAETGLDWLQFLSGGLMEMWVKYGRTAGEGYMPWVWERSLQTLKEAQARGKLFFGITHSDAFDDKAMRFGYASMLLGGEGRSHFALHHDYSDESWFPEYDYGLGEPTGADTTDGNGVHRRAFERGLVLVNPTLTGKWVSFGGTYSGSGLTAASGTWMEPLSGLVLEAG